MKELNDLISGKSKLPRYLLPLGAVVLLFPAQAQAYIGPGAGLSALGSLLALIAAVVVTLVGFIWYPVKRLLKNRRSRKEVVFGEGLTADISTSQKNEIE